MKKYILSLIVLALALNVSFAQDEEVTSEPVYGTFASGILIDQQTSLIPDARTLEFIIQHKFGSLDNGKSDLWGIYSPGANVRLALNYVPLNNFQVGAGITKKNMYTDFNAKWTLLEQTTDNSVPVAVTLYGVAAIDGRDATTLGTGTVVDSKASDETVDIGFSNRLSYFSQLIIGRKFGEWLSLQAGASFTHYNMVGWDYDHDVVGAHINGRIKFSPQSSIIINYELPLKIKSISEQPNWDTFAKPNLAVGFEVATFTHAFQMYFGSADGILPQDVMMYNQTDWGNGGPAIGFTITRIWMF
ncbi:MAG TPA: DUF5777 family beta-barrel protein [Prolixibacteraceae bacterium]|nr:DUF5777 family beta-barrel protein [Prolixibacteraceae bacterium]